MTERSVVPTMTTHFRRISVSLPAPLLESVDEVCIQAGVSRSRLARRLFGLYVKAHSRAPDAQPTIDKDGDRYILRSELVGVAGKVLQAAGVAAPPTLHKLAGQVA